MADTSGGRPDAGAGATGVAGVPSFYRAVAVDFDGTLTSDGKTPSPDIVDALAKARASGLRVLLVTGRIVKELEQAWPAARESVDCVVAENGAVLSAPAWHRLLADPVDVSLDAALSSAGVPFRRGEVLLAAAVTDEPSVLGCIRELHLGCQTVANRSELMVVPAGVSKGSGLYHALGHFGLSFHNTISIGDAENDLSLYELSELAVAVQDAVEPLKEHADIVLGEPDGLGIAAFLSGDVVGGGHIVHSSRWKLRLGATPEGDEVSLPASQANVLVAGGTGSGKSYVAGLLAEQLVEAGYSVLVIDPEGDHVGLNQLSGGLVVGDGVPLPDPDEVLPLLHHRYVSVVVDLSSLESGSSRDYQRALLTRVEAHRRRTGLPHWVFIDEADQTVGRVTASLPVLEPAQKGYCLVTWRPEDLAAEAVAALDAVVTMDTLEATDVAVNLAAAIGQVPRVEVARLLGSHDGSGVLTRRDLPHHAQPFTVADRETPHLRHYHKYDHRPLDPEHGFHFRRSVAERTGTVAANLAELEEALSRCDRSVLRHHCPGHDFSRWVADVFHDTSLASRLAAVESSVSERSPAATVEKARLELIAVLAEKLVG